MLFLARWGRRLSWAEAGRIFRCSWERVRRSVEWAVDFGLENRRLDDFEAIGIDELHWGKGKKSENYLTVIYALGEGVKRLLWCGQRRTEKSLRQGLESLAEENRRKGQGVLFQRIKIVCSDMWKAYLSVLAKKLPRALNVLDPFHIAKHLNEAVDKVRRGEQSRLQKVAKKEAKKSRYLILKRGTRVLGHARARLKAALGVLRDTAKAWELKESFRQFWKYRSPTWAGAYVDEWIARRPRGRDWSR